MRRSAEQGLLSNGYTLSSSILDRRAFSPYRRLPMDPDNRMILGEMLLVGAAVAFATALILSLAGCVSNSPGATATSKLTISVSLVPPTEQILTPTSR